MDITLLIAVFLIASTVFMLFVGYMSTKAVLPSRDAYRADEFQQRLTALMRQGQYQAVITQATEELQAHPQFAAAYRFRAEAYRSTSQPDEAIADYTSALEHMNLADVAAQAELLDARGRLWQQTGEHDMAIRDFDDCLALVPANAATRVARAQSLTDLGDAATALEDLHVAIESNPYNPAAYELRARVRKSLGQVDGVEVDLRRAKRLREGTADW